MFISRHMVVLLLYASLVAGSSAESRTAADVKAERLIVRVLNGELLGCNASETKAVLGETNWVTEAVIVPGVYHSFDTNEIHDVCRVYLFANAKRWSPYCLALEFNQEIRLLELEREVRRFLQGIEPRGNPQDHPISISQYWVTTPGNWEIQHFANGRCHVVFCSEFGPIEIRPHSDVSPQNSAEGQPSGTGQ